MDYFIYILYSSKIDRYYVGYSDNVPKRLSEHNAGKITYTSKGKPWILVYTERFQNKTDAIRRDRQIEKMKSRKYIEDLIMSGSSEGRASR